MKIRDDYLLKRRQPTSTYFKNYNRCYCYLL